MSFRDNPITLSHTGQALKPTTSDKEATERRRKREALEEARALKKLDDIDIAWKEMWQ